MSGSVSVKTPLMRVGNIAAGGRDNSIFEHSPMPDAWSLYSFTAIAFGRWAFSLIR